MNQNPKMSVLFVCMGNICRSPTAEGVFRHLVEDAGLADRIHTDSAGTHAYHTHEPADRRAQAGAERRGYSLANIRARPVQTADFERFDYIVAMDADNLAHLTALAEPKYHDRLSLFLEFSENSEVEVPDPYFGGAAGFERVLDLVEEASRGLIEAIKSNHNL
jgi:protein-tyrosine phosphatase